MPLVRVNPLSMCKLTLHKTHVNCHFKKCQLPLHVIPMFLLALIGYHILPHEHASNDFGKVVDGAKEFQGFSNYDFEANPAYLSLQDKQSNGFFEDVGTGYKAFFAGVERIGQALKVVENLIPLIERSSGDVARAHIKDAENRLEAISKDFDGLTKGLQSSPGVVSQRVKFLDLRKEVYRLKAVKLAKDISKDIEKAGQDAKKVIEKAMPDIKEAIAGWFKNDFDVSVESRSWASFCKGFLKVWDVIVKVVDAIFRGNDFDENVLLDAVEQKLGRSFQTRKFTRVRVEGGVWVHGLADDIALSAYYHDSKAHSVAIKTGVSAKILPERQQVAQAGEWAIAIGPVESADGHEALYRLE